MSSPSKSKGSSKLSRKSYRQRKMEQEAQSGDKTFKEIKRQINKRSKKVREDDILEEIYVDSHRMVSVKFGAGNDDLKNIISKKTRRQMNEGEKLPPGEPSLEMYLKLAECFMRKGKFDEALYNIGEAADFNPESTVRNRAQLMARIAKLVLSAAGRCHSKMGNWEAALGSAEHVLTKEPKNTTAIFIKGEALFNLCDFEHALLHFTRGQTLLPDSEDFRFGISKCRKTIEDGVKDASVFQFRGVENLFFILRQNTDMQDQSMFMASYVERKLQNAPQMSFLGLASINKFRRKMNEKINKTRAAEGRTDTIDLLKKSHVVVESSDDETVTNTDKPKKNKNKNRMIRPAHPADRLAKDKKYLSSLTQKIKPRTDITRDRVQRNIRREAAEAVEYLKKREAFWEILELGCNDDNNTLAVESYRSLM